MKKILIPILAGLVLGGLVAFGLWYLEFGGVRESFDPFKPE